MSILRVGHPGLGSRRSFTADVIVVRHGVVRLIVSTLFRAEIVSRGAVASHWTRRRLQLLAVIAVVAVAAEFPVAAIVRSNRGWWRDGIVPPPFPSALLRPSVEIARRRFTGKPDGMS